MKHLLVSTNRDFFSALENAGLTLSQIKCIQVLEDAGEPLAVGAVSDRLGLSMPAVSRAVDQLVQRGEVKREEDVRDRRSKLLSVTARGRRSYDRLVAIRYAGVRRYVSGLSDDERAALGAALEPLTKELRP